MYGSIIAIMDKDRLLMETHRAMLDYLNWHLQRKLAEVELGLLGEGPLSGENESMLMGQRSAYKQMLFWLREREGEVLLSMAGIDWTGESKAGDN